MKKQLKVSLRVTVFFMIFAIAGILQSIPGADWGTKAQAASYSGDYRYWSQGASDDYNMRQYGCWVTAQAKLLYETNVDRSAGFNPDSYLNWQRSNGLINSGFYQTNGGNAPSIYASQKGKQLTYLGNWNADANQLWFNINAGYYTIVKVPGHYVMLANQLSKEKGVLYCYDSWTPSSSVAPQPLSRYSSWQSGYVYRNDSRDTTPPTISNVRITDVNADGYTVVCNVSDNVGISKVEFPSWNTDKHRGEDANWIQGSVSGNTASARISLSSLKSGAVQGNYVTHIYAWDSSGNKSGVPTSIVYIDRTAPTLTDIKVVEKDSKGYTVECKASDASGVDRVQFPTWTAKNDQDDIAKDWWTNQAVRGTRVSGDTYRFRVNISEHNNEVGSYVTHIYVYDKYGNYSCGRSGCVVPLGLLPQRIVKYGNSLLSLYNENYSWDEMKTLSGKLQSKLAEVEDAQKQQVITNLVSDQIRQYYYIGGSQAGKGQPWKWQSGSSVTYTNWDAAQPDCAGNSEFYMAATRGHGRWNDMPSSYIYSGFILETPLNLKPAAEITYGNKVYRFYTAGIPYALAERYCEELGGNLVKIESEEKNNVIAQKVKELNKTFYIGASDEKEEGKFVWRDGSAVTYTNWSQNGPNNSADCGGENYVQMYANGKWNDYTGQSVDIGFIGEFDETPTATSTPAPTNTPNATQKPQATNRPQSTKKPQATKKPSSQNDDADYNWSSDDTSSDDVTVKKVTGVKVKKAAKKSLIVTWRWFVSQDGFEVQYALNKSFTKKKKTKRYDLYAERVKLRGLKRKKTYYVRVRAFKKVGTEKVYGKWSITKKCKVK